ncbi:cation efflux system protein CusF [Deltaproteobacteria bacterium]|nr:cation efflux system protein CusF [Deltaproteobacteria bacterium]
MVQTMFLLLALAVSAAGFAGFSQAAMGHGSHGGMNAGQARTPEKSSLYSTTGVINKVDLSGRKLTISHQPVPAVNWPAMTMTFTVEADVSINEAKVGDKVRFDFYNQGSASVIVDMEIL